MKYKILNIINNSIKVDKENYINYYYDKNLITKFKLNEINNIEYDLNEIINKDFLILEKWENYIVIYEPLTKIISRDILDDYLKEIFNINIIFTLSDIF